MGRGFFIHTFGCQMNESDSARMAEALVRIGYTSCESAEQADLILLNTCAVRDKAEQKMLSALGRYRAQKVARGTLLGVAGCVAQQHKKALLERVPYIDFVLGPDAIPRLAAILAEVEEQHRRVAATDWVDSSGYLFPRAEPDAARGKVSDFITVMKGCDNVCSYCIVPKTRGREVSRPVGEVVEEAKALLAVGVKELTLLGQNVNSYDGGCDFAELLARVGALDGLARLRFTTSHPTDLSDRLADAFATIPALMPCLHLPVQSGSNRILEKMRRGYTVEHYLERIERLRQARPEIAVTTDLIVGFPGETEEDFHGTLALCEQVRYDNSYSFVFSPRPGTSAAIHEQEWGAIPREVMVERLERLQARARAISLEIANGYVGEHVEVLVEGPSKTDPTRSFGRAPSNRVINFEGVAAPGERLLVEITGATPNALFGRAAVREAAGPRE